MDKKLEVKNLQISFRTQGGIVKAVRNISFDLYKGETLAIVGESGSGKSVTSRSIMGILAGNSIVEGGEILYDGQDLLKISEEDYHKIRGDKIAMIFQDPMSSLNPIMKVGQQLTEAMILKAKTGKKNAKREFNTLLQLLSTHINAQDVSAGVDNKALVEQKTKKFDAFCIQSTKIEGEFNEAYGNAVQLEVEIENVMLLIKKKRQVDLSDDLKSISKAFSQVFNPYVVVKTEENAALASSLAEIAKNAKKLRYKDAPIKKGEENKAEGRPTYEAALEVLEKAYAVVKDALAKDTPNFFTLGYYLSENPGADVTSMPVKDLNRMTREYLDNNFMIDFIAMAEKGVAHSHKESIARKKAAIPALEEALIYFKGTETLDHKKCDEYVRSLSACAVAAIDKLCVKKNSTEYVFKSAIATSVKEYFDGIRNNPIEEKIYLKNKKKYDEIIAKGDEPEWILKPQVIVDLDLKRANICKVIENLHASYLKDVNEDSLFDNNAHVIEIIDFLKEQASRLVVQMNQRIAKAKAIKLLEEVGIPEPAARFNQYPFELSGGMRQRIVIAIALSANPDILICDEPTTALDVTIQAQILELINNIKRERNLSVIFITHNLGVVANMADRIAVMYAGKIVEIGTSEEVFYEPAHPYTWALLSSMPDLHTTERLDSIPGTPPNMIYPPKGDAFAERNKYALEIDFELEPPLFEITDTHSAATWLLHPNAPKVEMPKIIKERIERLEKERQ